jgi:hypothetical protein
MILFKAPVYHNTGDIKETRKFAWFPTRIFKGYFNLHPQVRYTSEEIVEAIRNLARATGYSEVGPVIWLEYYIERAVYLSKQDGKIYSRWPVISREREVDKFLQKLEEN